MYDYLEHHGIIGMIHGLRRGPPYPLGLQKSRVSKLLKKSYTTNLPKWGKEKDSNICFIAGYSGSGKSTIAQGLLDENVDVIHLDLYFQPGVSSADTEKRNENFSRFLAERKVVLPADVSLNNFKRLAAISQFEKAIKDFGRLQYDKKRRVIVEGVELLEKDLFQDKSFFNDKPLILAGTSSLESMRRAFIRDGKGGLPKGLANLNTAASYISWYYTMSRSLKEIRESSNAKRGDKAIDEVLRKIKSKED